MTYTVKEIFAPATGVYTNAGVRPIRDVAPGDLVLGIDGEYREVTERLVYNQTDPMVEIRLKHAIEPLRVTAGHPVLAIRGVPLEQGVSLRWFLVPCQQIGRDFLAGCILNFPAFKGKGVIFDHLPAHAL